MKEIENAFRSFVNSSRHKIMLVSCQPEHSPLLLKSLEGIEDDPANPDLFLTFGHTFDNAEAYVGGVVASLREQFAQVNEELIKRGDQALPELPTDVEDGKLLPESRLAKAMEHVRGITPRGRQLIWVYYPLEIAESDEAQAEYLHVIDYLRNQIKERPIRASKLIVRDSSTHTLIRRLKDQPEVRFYLPALDPDSMRQKLNEQANNPKVPPEEQAHMHMMLAPMDVANGNFDQALARNEELLGYFRHTGQVHHQSVVLSNIGDIHYMQGRYDLAQQSYEQAIHLSVEQKSQPLVIYQSINLGNSLLMQKKYDEALVYYQSAEQLAEINKALPYQLQSLERIGDVKLQAGQPGEAARAWEKAADLCRKCQYDLGLRPILERLLRVYRELGNNQGVNECARALAELARRTT